MENIEIVKEWLLPPREMTRKDFKQTDKSNPMFYVVAIQKGRERYLKIGTAENGISPRFIQADYKKYSTIRFLYVAELQATKKDGKNVCYHIEDLTRSALREMKGLTFVRNDRFKYFQLPKEIPLYTSLNKFFTIPLVENKGSFLCILPIDKTAPPLPLQGGISS
jgi:hypothetical protein